MNSVLFNVLFFESYWYYLGDFLKKLFGEVRDGCFNYDGGCFLIGYFF